MKHTRREFIQGSATLSAAAMLSAAVGADAVFGKEKPARHPNILLLMVDQQHMPPAYGPGKGMAEGLKRSSASRDSRRTTPSLSTSPATCGCGSTPWSAADTTRQPPPACPAGPAS